MDRWGDPGDRRDRRGGHGVAPGQHDAVRRRVAGSLRLRGARHPAPRPWRGRPQPNGGPSHQRPCDGRRRGRGPCSRPADRPRGARRVRRRQGRRGRRAGLATARGPRRRQRRRRPRRPRRPVRLARRRVHRREAAGRDAGGALPSGSLRHRPSGGVGADRHGLRHPDRPHHIGRRGALLLRRPVRVLHHRGADRRRNARHARVAVPLGQRPAAARQGARRPAARQRGDGAAAPRTWQRGGDGRHVGHLRGRTSDCWSGTRRLPEPRRTAAHRCEAGDPPARRRLRRVRVVAGTAARSGGEREDAGRDRRVRARHRRGSSR